MNNKLFAIGGLAALLAASSQQSSCSDQNKGDIVQRQQQNQLEDERSSQVGFPAIVNFAEARELKQIFEMRDQQIRTYSYTLVQMLGKYIYLGQTVGFPLPYATQFTNPMKPYWPSESNSAVVPQADPNGLYSPAAADATWILLLGPDNKVKPAYVEEKVECFTYPLPDELVLNAPHSTRQTEK